MLSLRARVFYVLTQFGVPESSVVPLVHAILVEVDRGVVGSD